MRHIRSEAEQDTHDLIGADRVTPDEKRENREDDEEGRKAYQDEVGHTRSMASFHAVLGLQCC